MPHFRDELYFAYGSNLNVEQMLGRCPAAEPARGLVIKHWQLHFRRVADIAPAAGRQVVGGLWRVTTECERALDRYEGVAAGLYRKVLFRTGGQVAFMYLMNAGVVQPPPRVYYDSILTGYRDWGFDVHPLRLALITAIGEVVRSGFRRPATVHPVAKPIDKGLSRCSME